MTFPESDQARLLLNFDFPTEERTQILGVTARQVSPMEIEGSIKQKNGYALEFTVHFVLQLSRPLTSLDDWCLGDYTGKDVNYGTEWRRPATYEKGITHFSGKGSCGLVMNFQTKAGEKILVRTGISLVSVEQARLNLATELKAIRLGFRRRRCERPQSLERSIEPRRGVWRPAGGSQTVLHVPVSRLFGKERSERLRRATTLIFAVRRKSSSRRRMQSIAVMLFGERNGHSTRSGHWSRRALPHHGLIIFWKLISAAAGCRKRR